MDDFGSCVEARLSYSDLADIRPKGETIVDREFERRLAFVRRLAPRGFRFNIAFDLVKPWEVWDDEARGVRIFRQRAVQHRRWHAPIVTEIADGR